MTVKAERQILHIKMTDIHPALPQHHMIQKEESQLSVPEIMIMYCRHTTISIEYLQLNIGQVYLHLFTQNLSDIIHTQHQANRELHP